MYNAPSIRHIGATLPNDHSGFVWFPGLRPSIEQLRDLTHCPTCRRLYGAEVQEVRDSDEVVRRVLVFDRCVYCRSLRERKAMDERSMYKQERDPNVDYRTEEMREADGDVPNLCKLKEGNAGRRGLQAQGVGKLIRELRQAKNWTQFELSKQLGITIGNGSQISNWEIGQTIPRAEALTRLAQVFGVDVKVFLENKDYIVQRDQLESRIRTGHYKRLHNTPSGRTGPVREVIAFETTNGVKVPAIRMDLAVRFLRELRHLSQRDAAKLIGVPRTYFSRIENGKAQPTANSVVRFAEVFKVPPAFLIELAMVQPEAE